MVHKTDTAISKNSKNIFNFANIITTTFLFLFVVLAQAQNTPYPYSSTLRRIVDGDTIHVNVSNTAYKKIRMTNMDTAELHFPDGRGRTVAQPVWGERATQKLTELMSAPNISSDGLVWIDDHGLDKYGRTLGVVMLKMANGQFFDVNLAMVATGSAHPYFICTGPDCNETYLARRRIMQYVEACESAKAEQLGVHHPTQGLAELPFEFRARMSRTRPSRFVADVTTRQVMAPSEYRRIDVCKRIFFNTREDAVRAGFDVSRL